MQFVLTIVLTYCLLFIIVPDLSATTTRVMNLGGIDEFVHDETNIYIFPATAVLYPNFVFAECGEVISPLDEFKLDIRNQTVGGFASADTTQSIGIFGIILNRKFTIDSLLAHPTFLRGKISYREIFYPQRQIEMFYAKKITPTLALGLHYASSGYRKDALSDIDNTIQLNRFISIRKCQIGIRYGRNNNTDLEFSCGIGTYNFQTDSTFTGDAVDYINSLLKSDTKLAKNFLIRTSFRPIEFLTIFQVAGYTGRELESLYQVENVVKENSVSSFVNCKWGIGTNISWKKESRVFFGAVIGYTKITEKTTDDSLKKVVHYEQTKIIEYPRIIGALEAQLKPWCFIRIGGSKVIQSEEKKADSWYYTQKIPKESIKTSPFEFFIGGGFKISTLKIDFLLNQDIPFVPSSFTGIPNEIPIYRISGTYYFGI